MVPKRVSRFSLDNLGTAACVGVQGSGFRSLDMPQHAADGCSAQRSEEAAKHAQKQSEAR